MPTSSMQNYILYMTDRPADRPDIRKSFTRNNAVCCLINSAQVLNEYMYILEGEGNADSLRCYALIKRSKNKYEVKKDLYVNFLQD